MTEEYQTFGVRLPVEDIEFLEAVADRRHVARVTVLRWAIDNFRKTQGTLFLTDCPTGVTIDTQVAREEAA